MRAYDYKCNECGHVFAIMQAMTAEPEKEIPCKKCGQVTVTRLVRIGIETENRIRFLDHLPKNAVCAEMGCMKGGFSYYILEITNPKRFFMVDPYWKAYGATFQGMAGGNIGTYDCFTRAARKAQLSSNYQVTTAVVEYDTVFLQDYPDNFFDWIYLDTIHKYKNTLLELELLKAKVKDEGIICGHDYRSSRHPELTTALHEWLDKNTDYELYLIDNHLQWIVKRK